MLITRKADYATRCMIQLAVDPAAVLSVAELAPAIHVSEAFTAKVMQSLTKAGLVESVRGARGGFRLARPPADISLLAVLEALQGPLAINVCVDHGQGCELSPGCVVHPVWCDLRRDLESRLRAVDFATLASNLGGRINEPCYAFPSTRSD